MLVGYGFKAQFDSISTFWPASGTLLAALVLVPKRAWPIIATFAAVAEVTSAFITSGEVGGMSLRFAVANVTEGLVGASLYLVIVGHRLTPRSMREGARLALTSVALAPALGALIAATFLVVNFPEGPSFASQFQVWWLADVLGVLILTPGLLI